MGNNTNKPLRENNMSYKHKTIIIAIAAVTSSAIKLRSKTIFDDIGHAFEDAGEWIEGAAEDVGDVIVEAAEGVGDVVVEAAEGVGEAVADVVDVTDELLEGMWEEVVGDAELFEAAGQLVLDDAGLYSAGEEGWVIDSGIIMDDYRIGADEPFV